MNFDHTPYGRPKILEMKNQFSKRGYLSFGRPVLIYIFVSLLLFISCRNSANHSLFELLAPEDTGLDFVNLLEEDESFNIIEYLYFYNGGGVAVGDINNDGFPDVYLTSNQQPNKLYLNLGTNASGKIKFKDITDQAGVAGSGNWSTGVSMVDVNADGWLDIYLCQVGGYKEFQGRNQLFINQGCRSEGGDSCSISFLDKAAQYGLDHMGFSTQSAFFDYDLDGDLDMYLLCHSVHSSESYRDTTSTRLRDPLQGDKFFENRSGESLSSGKIFTEIGEEVGIYSGIAGYGLGITIGDIDKNGFPDIYVGNDFHEDDFLYLNQGDGTFKESSSRLLSHTSYYSMGNDLADINNDGWLDIMTLDMKPDNEVLYKSAQGPDPYDIYRFKRSFGYHHQFPQNALQINQGGRSSGDIRFSEIAQMMGVSSTDWSWSTIMADLNLDGWKDLYITNGVPRRPNNLDYLKYISNQEIQNNASDLELVSKMPSGKISNYAFSNQNGKQLIDRTSDWGLERPSISHGAVCADFDLDGDLDLVVNNLNEPLYLYKNLTRENKGSHFLTIKLVGPAKNPVGIGTGVAVYADTLYQYQELYLSKGWLSSVDPTFHFGLGNIKTIDSILIQWPDSRSELIRNISSDQILEVDYQNAKAGSVTETRDEASLNFSSVDDEEPLFVHRENEFFDNTREPLMPYLLSTQGPKISVSDVNGDQLEDFYIGGASGQVGALLIQNANGDFSRSGSSAFLDELEYEDTGLAFFDADADQDQDLYIASGGNQFYGRSDRLGDRLYLNDGAGHFTRAHQRIPEIYEQSSCVKPCDFDADGDIDLFVGTRSTGLNYGYAPDSYLLLNDGTGSFSKASQELIDLSSLGMVTDAVWCDVEQDGFQDLVVVGDWMPVVVFHYDGQNFTKSAPTESPHGLWNTVVAHDLDQDGDQDLVLGNLGLNSNLQASIEQPLKLYISDFDSNLTSDPVVSYYKQGKEYPLLGMDALGSQMVFLKKKFRSYDDFATKTIEEIFTKEQLYQANKKIVTSLQSFVALNDGLGAFSFKPLPDKVQASTANAVLIADFNGDQHSDIFIGGNFYDLQPTIGRMDASYGTLLLGTDEGWFRESTSTEFNQQIDGQIRDLKIIDSRGRKLVLVAVNNAAVEWFELKAGS